MLDSSRIQNSKTARAGAIDLRIDRLDWSAITQKLDASGFVVIGPLLTAAECRELADLYLRDELFRSRVVMARHGFGSGEYKYFDYPLPPLVNDLRTLFYERLVAVANKWIAALKLNTPFPPHHEQMLARCHAVGQRRPTPLLLKYQAGDYNCLHQDVYGEHVFPLQVTFLLSRPDKDFEGGEFLLLEQRPRLQSRAEVVPLAQGEGVIFAVRHRPVEGKRGSYRVNMRHGVSRVRSGSRYTMGVIFHDAA
jgi:uncharacterized protein